MEIKSIILNDGIVIKVGDTGVTTPRFVATTNRKITEITTASHGDRTWFVLRSEDVVLGRINPDFVVAVLSSEVSVSWL